MEYSIKAAAEKCQLSPNTLRYYEKEGLLPHVKRSQSGIRRYTEQDLEWLGLICCLKNTGMSIRQIRDFVDLSLQGPDTLKDRCDILRAHKQEVEAHIAELNRYLQKVNAKIAFFNQQFEAYQKA
ncbi:MerR family transcriptional regulator [Oscillospiraceae bacterium HV4-5-C5C]|nr:MerR family transcriptional regulator [Oscillospiraceae bacterium HV4-5-C5C]